jgi:hypothetical protein
MSDPTGEPDSSAKRPTLAAVPPARTDPAARTVRFLNKSFPQSYAALSLLPRLATGYVWLRKLEKAHAGRRLSELSLQDRRTSDTVFVFGTGSSINDYPEPYWDVVRNHDSIGMNFFLLHDHVPTFHVMESVTKERHQLLRIRYAETGDYKNTPLIIKTQLTNLSSNRVGARISELTDLPAEVLANTYLSLDILAAGKTATDMEAAYRLTQKVGLWKPKPQFLMLTKRRGSVAYVVNFAVRAGYRRIVLCGVDLNHTEHFYDSRRQELEAAGLPVPSNREYGSVHSTNDPANHPVTIQNVLSAIKDNLLEPAGIELLVGSSTSALYPDISCFDWGPTINRSTPRHGGSH